MKKLVALVLSALLVFGLVSFAVATPAEAVAETYGLGIVNSITGNDAVETDGKKVDGQSQVNSIICLIVLDDNNVIKAIQFDAVQAPVKFSMEGKITTDITVAPKTKIEKGDEYGMKKASAIGKEWFEQIAEFEKYCIGKTVEEVLATPLYKRDDSHTTVADVADLKTTVTIDIGEFLDAIQKAAANAK